MLKDLCPISKITPGHRDFLIWACSAFYALQRPLGEKAMAEKYDTA